MKPATATDRPLLAALRALRRRRSLILCYHGVGQVGLDADPDNLLVPPERFRRQIELLLAAGFELVTVSDFAARLTPTGPPPGIAAVTFDDGMEDNHHIVLPIMRALGVPATVYVATGLIGQQNPWLGASARMMVETELRTLAEAGFEIGAHTVTHPDLSLLDRAACVEEMRASRDTLERIVERPVTSFAYPFCHYGPDAVAAAAEVGFSSAATCHARGSWEPLELKRSMITGKDGLASYLLKLCEAYYPLVQSRAGTLARSSTRSARRRLRAWRASGGDAPMSDAPAAGREARGRD